MDYKEEAEKLHDKYYRVFEMLGVDDIPNEQAKKCALIDVENRIDCLKDLIIDGEFFGTDELFVKYKIDYLNYVKSELENL